MADKIKGISIEIGGDTKGLSKALGEVKKETNGIQTELKSVERLLKLDPKNTELLAQKQQLLSKQVETTKDKLEALKTAKKKADDDMKNGTEVNEKQYRLLQREIIQTEQTLKGLEKATDKFARAGEKLKGVGGKMTDIGKKGMAVTGTIVGVGAALAKMGIDAALAADDINTLSTQTGLSTSEIQKFQYASELIDVPMETLTGSMSKLIKNMASAQNGSKNVQKAFNELGITYVDNDGKLRNNQEVFAEAIDALGKMENSTQRDAYAMQMFGKSAQDLNPLILGGADALKQLGDEAESAGLILDQETLDSANKFNDAMDMLKAKTQGQFMKIGAEIAEKLTPLLEILAEKIQALLSWFGGLSDSQKGILLIIAAVVAAIPPLLIIIGTLAMAIGAIASPVSLVVAAVVALVAIFAVMYTKCDWFRNGVNEIFATIKEFFKSFVSAIESIWKNNTVQILWEGTWNAIQIIFKFALDSIKSVFAFWSKIFQGDFKGAFEVVKQHFANVWNTIKALFSNYINVLKTIAIKIGTAILTAIKEKLQDVKNWFVNIFNDIKTSFFAKIEEFKDVGKNLIMGLWNGINDKVQWLKDKVSGVVDKIKGWFTGKDGFDERSPSRWAKQVGVFLMEGLANGITEDMSVEDATKKKMENIKTFISTNLDNINNEFADKQKNLVSKLTEGAGMTEEVSLFSFNGEVIKGKQLNNWTDEIAAVRDYNDTISSTGELLKGVFGEDTEGYTAMMDIIRESSRDDALNLSKLILGADETELKNYVDGWKELQTVSKQTAEGAYAEELATGQLGFLESVTDGLSVVPDEFKTTGKTAAEYFGDGFMESISQVLDSIKQTISVNLGNMSVGNFIGPMQSAGATINNTTNSPRTFNITTNGGATAGSNAIATKKALNSLILQGVL